MGARFRHLPVVALCKLPAPERPLATGNDGQLYGDLVVKTSTRHGLIADAHDSRLSGCPVQRDSAAVDGRQDRAQG